MKHLLDNNLLSDCQYGFRPGRSCSIQLLEVLDQWSELLDSSNPVDTIYLDFSKAFDTVPHERLLSKLFNLGVQGKTLEWIKCFLSNRTQCVRINNIKSSPADVVSGVPQGSVLGPVLFLSFINDLPETVSGLIKIFADDSKIYSSVESDQQHQNLQDDLDRLCDWSRKWKLSFNASKCKVLHLGNNNNCLRYTMLDNHDNYVQISPVDHEKDLGVTFEDNLKFERHITDCVNKAQRVLSLIRRSFDYMEKDMFIILYKSIVRPLLEYSTMVWSPYLKKDIRKIENIQRRATKLVPEIRSFSYEDRLKALGLPTLEYRRDRYDMIQVFKALQGIDDIKWQSMFNLSVNPTRGHPWKLQKKRCNTTQRLHSFTFRVVDQWNSLSSETVSSKSVNIFKGRLNEEDWNSNKFHPS